MLLDQQSDVVVGTSNTVMNFWDVGLWVKKKKITTIKEFVQKIHIATTQNLANKINCFGNAKTTTENPREKFTYVLKMC